MPPLHLFDLGGRPHADRAAAGAIGVDDAGSSEDRAARREVGALDELHEVVGRGVGIVDQVDDGVDDLAEVVRRDVRGHADRDALAAVDQQVREAGRQHLGALELARVVVDEVDGVLVDAGHAAAWRAARAGTRCSARRPRRSRASRSCRGSRSAGGAARTAGPCGRARRRSRSCRAGGTCATTSPVTRAHFTWGRSGRKP